MQQLIQTPTRSMLHGSKGGVRFAFVDIDGCTNVWRWRSLGCVLVNSSTNG
jgi:hypothetical protein